MAQERTHRRRDNDSGRPGNDTEHQQDAADNEPPPSDHNEFDRPADVAALREARLKSMATPAAARKKMKIESRASRPVRTQSVKPRSTPSWFGRRASVSTVRPTTATNGSTKKGSKEDGYDSVYKTRNPSLVDRRDFQKEHDALAKSVKEEGKTKTVEKRKSERRKTEPAPTIRRSSTTASTRPPVRKSTTPVKVKQVESKDDGKEPRDVAARTETVVSAAKSTTSQRTSILAGLFAKPPPVPEKLVSCLTCGSDDIPLSKSARLPCTHRMCHSCLRRIFKMSIKDPAHMPPRCCTSKHIDLKHVDKLFNDEFKKTWNRKFKEYNAKNRIYCPRRGCGEWIQPKHMRIEQGRKIGVCPKCRHAVCAICNQRAHKSRECPKDPTVQQFNEMAKQKGWIKCYNCSATVELKDGCNHMTCRCTAQFCMICGTKWKNCDCPWFTYDAVGDLNGDPVRYQQEMDRRREQERRDEEMAREMAGLNVRRRNRDRQRAPAAAAAVHGDDFHIANVADHQVNADFVQQAREALTANYQNAEIAARGLLGGWLTGRVNPLPAGVHAGLDQQTAQLQPQAPRNRRGTYRVRYVNG